MSIIYTSHVYVRVANATSSARIHRPHPFTLRELRQSAHGTLDAKHVSVVCWEVVWVNIERIEVRVFLGKLKFSFSGIGTVHLHKPPLRHAVIATYHYSARLSIHTALYSN